MKVNLINENFTEDYVGNLLRARGVENVEDYFNPTDKYLLNPTDLKNIRLAAALYTRVVANAGNILIVVDPDVDGFTSAAIIYQYTLKLNPNCQVDYWLHEGKAHGLSDHIEELMNSDKKYDLLILPDSSSNDAHYHDMLEEVHLPCLILDHHETDIKLSDNAVVVNNQLSPNYSNKALTGAGVVYQFCRFLDSTLGHNWANDYIDLAALGIIADMGSMLSMENRYITKTGLTEENIKNDFFKCLLNKQAYSITGKQGANWSQIAEAANAMSVAFYIVPMINAMIRVGTMAEKERLFLAFIKGWELVPSGKRGAKGAMERVDVESARECTNAKNKQNKIKEAAVERLEAKIFKYDLLENKILLLELEDDDCFPSELNGLVATQLANKYKIPTLVGRRNSQNFLRGSIRGLNDSELKNFKQFLTDSGLFDYVQGHANAAGYSIDGSKIDSLLAYANDALSSIDFGENNYDVNFAREASARDLPRLIMALGEANNIWGQNNPTPLIHVTHMMVSPSDVRIMGTNQDTVKIEVNGVPYIRFHAKDMIEELKEYDEPFIMEIVGKPNLNEWMGRISPQMFIEDYEIKPISKYSF